MTQVIPCIHRFLEAPVKAAEEYHAEVFDFLFKWIAEAPWLDHTIDPKVAVPVVRTRNEKIMPIFSLPTSQKWPCTNCITRTISHTT